MLLPKESTLRYHIAQNGTLQQQTCEMSLEQGGKAVRRASCFNLISRAHCNAMRLRDAWRTPVGADAVRFVLAHFQK